jgi:nucleoside-diphosphate-sugar epimerase
MKVLLTGHLGYLGTVMAPILTAAGHEVVGLDSGLYADSVLGPLPTAIPALNTDIRDIRAEQLEGFDAVVHLAALSNDPLGSFAAQHTYDINHFASTRLAKLAKGVGVERFLYASTCSVYGAAGDGLVTEEAILAPITPYAESKVRVEADLHELADDSFTPVYLRNATAFGFSPRLRADIVLNNLVGHAILTDKITVLSDGTPWRPLVHALDIAQAFELSLAAPKEAVHDQAFNVGMEENNVTVADIAKEVAGAVPHADLNITGETGADPRSYRVDFSKIRAALPDFTPQWTVRAGAEELAEAYRAYGLTWPDFTEKFTRLAVLKARTAAGTVDASLRPTYEEISG